MERGPTRAAVADDAFERSTSESKRPLRVADLARILVAFLIAAELGRRFSPPGSTYAALWPASAVLLAALVLGPRSDWWRIVLLAAVPANLVFDLAIGRATIAQAVADAFANSLEAWIGASLLVRLGPPSELFVRVGSTLRALAALVPAPLVAALLAAGVEVATRPGAVFWRAWALGAAADLIGLVTLFPLLVLLWQEGTVLPDVPLRGRRALEFGGMLVLTAFVGWIVYLEGFGRTAIGRGATSWILPLVIWGALRAGRRGVSTVILLWAGCAIWGTVHGLGPFSPLAGMEDRILSLQVYLVSLSATALTLAASIFARNRAEAERAETVAHLEAALAEIKTLRGVIPICAHCRKIRDEQGEWQVLERYVSEHTDAQMSHGLCPDCIRALYPGMKLDRKG